MEFTTQAERWPMAKHAGIRVGENDPCLQCLTTGFTILQLQVPQLGVARKIGLKESKLKDSTGGRDEARLTLRRR